MVKIKGLDFTVGADPEVFIIDKRNQRWVNPINFTDGTKENPERIDDGFSLQVDGLALEINLPPARLKKEFLSIAKKGLSLIEKRIGKSNRIFRNTTMHITPRVWDDIDPKQKELGCAPDYDAVTGEIRTLLKHPKRIRFAGGHIHIGWGEGFDVNDPEVINAGRILSNSLANQRFLKSLDNCTDRTRYYGAGVCFRPKPYGTEFRKPSCRWFVGPYRHSSTWDDVKRGITEAMG
jgi:hypothetical protein